MENFVFTILVSALFFCQTKIWYFAFALPVLGNVYFCPLWTKTKWQWWNYVVVFLLLLPLKRVKEKCQNLEWQKQNGRKLVWKKQKIPWTEGEKIWIILHRFTAHAEYPMNISWRALLNIQLTYHEEHCYTYDTPHQSRNPSDYPSYKRTWMCLVSYVQVGMHNSTSRHARRYKPAVHNII